MPSMTLLASDPLYPAWDWLLTMRAAMLNHACHYDLRDMPEPERRAEVARLDAEVVEAWQELSR